MKSSKLPYKIWRKHTGAEFTIAAFLDVVEAHNYFNNLKTYPDEDVEYILKENGKQTHHKGSRFA